MSAAPQRGGAFLFGGDMHKFLHMAAVLFLLLAMIQCAQAQVIGYEMTTTPPNSGMIPIGTVVMVPVTSWSGTVNEACTITAYVIWRNPVKPPEYYVELASGGWTILPRENINQFNPEWGSRWYEPRSD